MTTQHTKTIQDHHSPFKDIKLSIRNIDGKNPLDLAVTKRNNAIVKLLCKHTKPEISSLIHAVETSQPEFVRLICDELKKDISKHSAKYLM